MSNYNNNELRKHKASDMIKWVIVFVLILALLASVVMIGLKVYGVLDKKDEAPSEDEAAKGDNVVSEIEEQDRESDLETGAHISLKSSYATSPTGTDKTTMTLTATVEPATADQTVDWSIAFKNPSSTWATGKNIADYMTVTPSEDGSKTATVKVLKAYGEQIVVTVASRESVNKKATCTFDYVKSVSIGSSFLISDPEGGSFDTKQFDIRYGEGTIEDEMNSFSVEFTNYDTYFSPLLKTLGSSQSLSSLFTTCNKSISSGKVISGVYNPLGAYYVAAADGGIASGNYYVLLDKSNYTAVNGKALSSLPAIKRIPFSKFMEYGMNNWGLLYDLVDGITDYSSQDPNAFFKGINAIKDTQNFDDNCLMFTLTYDGKYLHEVLTYKFIFPEFGYFDFSVESVSVSQSSYVFGGNK